MPLELLKGRCKINLVSYTYLLTNITKIFSKTIIALSIYTAKLLCWKTNSCYISKFTNLTKFNKLWCPYRRASFVLAMIKIITMTFLLSKHFLKAPVYIVRTSFRHPLENCKYPCQIGMIGNYMIQNYFI